jgi:hypothetical protein
LSCIDHLFLATAQRKATTSGKLLAQKAKPPTYANAQKDKMEHFNGRQVEAGIDLPHPRGHHRKTTKNSVLP